MDAARVLAGLRQRGLTLWVERTDAGLLPQLQGKPSAADAKLIKDHREAIIAMLEKELEAEEGRFVRFHDPWPDTSSVVNVAQYLSEEEELEWAELVALARRQENLPEWIRNRLDSRGLSRVGILESLRQHVRR